MPRHRAAVDRNQAEIVHALKKAGCDVWTLRRPVDLLVGRGDKNFLLEVKVPKAKGEKGGELTPEQVEFFESWRGQKAIVQSVEEALRAVELLCPAK